MKQLDVLCRFKLISPEIRTELDASLEMANVHDMAQCGLIAEQLPSPRAMRSWRDGQEDRGQRLAPRPIQGESIRVSTSAAQSALARQRTLARQKSLASLACDNASPLQSQEVMSPWQTFEQQRQRTREMKHRWRKWQDGERML